MRKTVSVGDLHAPFIHRPTLTKILDRIKLERPDNVVQVGDAYDFLAASRFAKSRRVDPVWEINTGQKMLREFWEAAHKAVPKASCYQLLGNHDTRPLSRIMESTPELMVVLEPGWKELYTFPGVDTLFDTRSDLVIDGVVYEHGYLSGQGAHLRQNMRPTVFGHTHAAGVYYLPIRNKVLWEMNVGYVADPRHEALKYTPKKYTRWVRGLGVVDGDGPRFIRF